MRQGKGSPRWPTGRSWPHSLFPFSCSFVDGHKCPRILHIRSAELSIGIDDRGLASIVQSITSCGVVSSLFFLFWSATVASTRKDAGSVTIPHVVCPGGLKPGGSCQKLVIISQFQGSTLPVASLLKLEQHHDPVNPW